MSSHSVLVYVVVIEPLHTLQFYFIYVMELLK